MGGAPLVLGLGLVQPHQPGGVPLRTPRRRQWARGPERLGVHAAAARARRGTELDRVVLLHLCGTGGDGGLCGRRRRHGLVAGARGGRAGLAVGGRPGVELAVRRRAAGALRRVPGSAVHRGGTGPGGARWAGRPHPGRGIGGACGLLSPDRSAADPGAGRLVAVGGHRRAVPRSVAAQSAARGPSAERRAAPATADADDLLGGVHPGLAGVRLAGHGAGRRVHGDRDGVALRLARALHALAGAQRVVGRAGSGHAAAGGSAGGGDDGAQRTVAATARSGPLVLVRGLHAVSAGVLRSDHIGLPDSAADGADRLGAGLEHVHSTSNRAAGGLHGGAAVLDQLGVGPVREGDSMGAVSAPTVGERLPEHPGALRSRA